MWPNYSASCRKEVDEILKKGGSLSAYRANKDYGSGPVKGSQAWKLEREIERKFRVKHAVALNSGTAALHAALVALDVRGRDVVTSPYTFSATASAILLAGARPVFADIDSRTFCITKETVKRVITKKTAAILPVHLFGYMADLSDLSSFGLPIVEDACQAVGANRGNAYSGTVGLCGAYSFNGSKNVPSGEGGCLVTNSDKIAEKARLLANHGENFNTQNVGFNYRMQEIVSCIARHGLKDLEERNQRRIDLVKRLWGFMELSGWNLKVPYPKDREHVYYVFGFPSPLRDRSLFIKRMAKRGVTCGAGYIQPTLNRYSAFHRYQTTPLPVAEELSSKTLCLLYCLTPEKPLSYARKVSKAIKESL